jgi:excinuclease ABC subunit B
MPDFKIVSDFQMTGDQPQAVEKLVNGLGQGHRYETLKGVTGSGKTFNMANVIEQVQRPTLVITHNKTLAGQLATEFRDFFPDNAVEYFVSYYDYYQPEAYVPQIDLYIEKEATVNDEIDKLRHAATRSLLTRRDVLIVASVSCIFGLGSPEDYHSFVAEVRKGEVRSRERLVRSLIDMQYERTNSDLSRSKFRVRGDTLEIKPAYEDLAIRIEFWGDEVERILQIDPLTGELISERDRIEIYPARHFMTSREKLLLGSQEIQLELEQRLLELQQHGKLLEAQRLEQRTNYDLEMLLSTGYCSGVENYSRPLGQRAAGSPPWTLLDYFPDDFLVFLDESHQTIPQLRGMYRGDMSRKRTLVDYGYRLPSAMDNRPLNFDEFLNRVNQLIFVSATPGAFELQNSQAVIEQVLRPTGLLDPILQVKPTTGQIDDLLEQIRTRVERNQRCLVTTLTKRMAEEMADYLIEMGVRTHYLHSEIDTLERSQILRDLRLGVYDVVVGINLLREGLDLPEVSFVAILDADKEGFLRSSSSLIQIIGRAARHEEGQVIMYADIVTESMRIAIDETNQRRAFQQEYNTAHGIIPQGIHKAIRDITDRVRALAEARSPQANEIPKELNREQAYQLTKELESQMKQSAKALEFEKAALLRDQVIELRKVLAMGPGERSE